LSKYQNCKDNFDHALLIWETIERLVYRVTVRVETKEDAERLLRKISKPRRESIEMNAIKSNGLNTSVNFSRQSSRPMSPATPDREGPKAINSSESIKLSYTSVPQPPPPPPLPPTSSTSSIPPPPPPPFPINLQQTLNLSQSSPPISNIEPFVESALDSSSSLKSELLKLPHLEVPKPKSKMKSLNWTKIPSVKVIHSRMPNIWSMFASTHQSARISANVDFDALEDLFCQHNNLTVSLPSSCPGSPSLNRANLVSSDNLITPYNSLERKLVKRLSSDYSCSIISDTNLNLLDRKKSLNVNIFLKQCRGSTNELIESIKVGNHQNIGAERLRIMLKLIPDKSEAEMLNAHKNEVDKMPIAEKFLLKIIQIPK